MPFPTAGQRSAAEDLHAAIRDRQPMILLFGESGSGKTALINSVLDTTDPAGFVVLALSATGGEFIGPPTFDKLLEAICRRLNAPRATKERPETIAFLTDKMKALVSEGKSLVLGIDHADQLSDDVVSELALLEHDLDTSPKSIISVFVGSLTLASRIDSVLRRLATDKRLCEIRLSPPSAEEVAALLAYEDGCQQGGPMLTPGAIERITAYAKSNLHWAVPMADAARILAENEGQQEVPAELVRSALHEIWSPEQREDGESSFPAEQRYAYTSEPTASRSIAPLGLSDSISPYLDLNATSESSAPQAARHRYAWRFAPAAFAFLLVAGVTAFFLRDEIVSLWPQEPKFVIQESLGPESLPEHVLRELTRNTNDAEGDGGQQEPHRENASTEPRAVGPEGESMSVPQDGLSSDGHTQDIKNVSKTKAPESKSPKRRPDNLQTDHWIQTR